MGRSYRLISPKKKKKKLRQAISDVLLLNTNEKLYMASPNVSLDLIFSDIERLSPRLLMFKILISPKGAELGHNSLLNTNGMPHGQVWLKTFYLEVVRPYITVKY